MKKPILFNPRVNAGILMAAGYFAILFFGLKSEMSGTPLEVLAVILTLLGALFLSFNLLNLVLFVFLGE